MEVILLERVAKLGQMGDTVKVKGGFARNFLLPKGKALRATEENLKRFENERIQLEARNLELRTEAETVSESLKDQTFVVIRQAGETGQLYGSVSTRDIAQTLTEKGFSVSRNQVILQSSIKLIGLHPVLIMLHPEVEVTVQLNVARSEEEAERQAKGEILVGRDEAGFELAEGDEDTEEGGGVQQSADEGGNAGTEAKKSESEHKNEPQSESDANSESMQTAENAESEKGPDAQSKGNADANPTADSNSGSVAEANSGESDSKDEKDATPMEAGNSSNESETSTEAGTGTETDSKESSDEKSKLA